MRLRPPEVTELARRTRLGYAPDFIMSAPLVSIHLEHPQPRIIARCLQTLEAGGVIAYPTDTCYAFGCDTSSKKALEKLFSIVRRKDRKKPVSLICPDLSDVARFGHVTNFAYRTMRHLTPGPFTFVLQATKVVPDMLMSRQKEVGLRVPDSEVPRALATGLGRPLANSSAHDPEGENLLVDPRDIKDHYGTALDLILDAGIQPAGQSTVVSLLRDEIEILRQGMGEVEVR